MYPHSNDPRDSAYPESNSQAAPDEEDAGPGIPDGDYPIRATKHRWGWSENKYPQIGISLTVTEGPYKGRRLTWYATFSDAAAEWTIKGLRALGMKGDDAERDIDTIYTSEAAATAVVANETYQGKTRAKVKFINGADIIMKNEMNGNELRSFSQRMKATFSRYAGGGGAAPAPAQQQQSRGPAQQQTRQTSQRQQERDPWDDAPPPDDRSAPPYGRR